MNAKNRGLLDRGMRCSVSAGGVGVILLVCAILVFLIAEAVPLALPARVGETSIQSIPGGLGVALRVDEHRTFAAGITPSGVLRVVRLEDGGVELEHDFFSKSTPLSAGGLRVLPGAPDEAFVAATNDGRALLAQLDWPVRFEGSTRVVTPQLGRVSLFVLDPSGGALGALAVRSDEGRTTAVSARQDGSLIHHVESVEENPFSGERTQSSERRLLSSRGRTLTHLVLDPDQRILYGASVGGELLWWDLQSSGRDPAEVVESTGSPVSALALLTGGRALAVGREDGGVAIWFRTQPTEFAHRLAPVRKLPHQAAPIVRLAPAQRDRKFLAYDANGYASIYFSTSNRLLWQGRAPLDAVAAAIAPKGDAIVFAGTDRVAEVLLEAPHPEAGFASYFQRVWYEGFEAPGHIWQSSGGSDDFESKLGLVPLISGTLKGAFYSLLFAVPLGLLGAMYTSQFMHPRLQRIVKPTIETMASLPSVVLGFIAGLWLAPRLEANFTGFLALILWLPAAVTCAGLIWTRFPRSLRNALPDGAEVGWFGLFLFAGLWASFASGPLLAGYLFDGNFQDWIYAATNTRYDQRNAVVVGIAMGFAVIPIIFSIAEDAFSNVPRNLVAGSLALGANRWETVIRVILPTASPAVFSAVMIGLGRAVGETMIVLMAAGNTPITDWNVLNGFRTLAANIAVEIPEAPHGATLYRTLFLTAVLLFGLTFFINTAAEVVRQSLRKRYARL